MPPGGGLVSLPRDVWQRRHRANCCKVVNTCNAIKLVVKRLQIRSISTSADGGYVDEQIKTAGVVSVWYAKLWMIERRLLFGDPVVHPSPIGSILKTLARNSVEH